MSVVLPEYPNHVLYNVHVQVTLEDEDPIGTVILYFVSRHKTDGRTVQCYKLEDEHRSYTLCTNAGVSLSGVCQALARERGTDSGHGAYVIISITRDEQHNTRSLDASLTRTSTTRIHSLNYTHSSTSDMYANQVSKRATKQVMKRAIDPQGYSRDDIKANEHLKEQVQVMRAEGQDLRVRLESPLLRALPMHSVCMLLDKLESFDVPEQCRDILREDPGRTLAHVRVRYSFPIMCS